MEDLCRAAYDRNFFSLGFSAHAPLPASFCPPTNWHLREDQLGEYAAAVREAKERWKGKLAVYLGLEIDFIPDVCGPADGRFDHLDLEYSIGSVHYLIPANGSAPFTVDGPKEETAQGIALGYGGNGTAAIQAYWDTLTAMIRAGSFDILGHMDLIKKNIHSSPWFNPADPAYRNGYSRAAEALAETGIVVEVNTGGMNRNSVPETYPSLEILHLLKELNIRTTINADAHQKRHLDGHYEDARSVLRASGYRTIVLFQGKWQEEPI